jgi:hypothetical protein
MANLIYELWPKDQVPDFTSPVGKMFIFLWIMRQEREFLANRATIQAIVAGDGNHKVVQSAFDDLANAFNPYLEGHKIESEKKAKERMLKEIKRGALSFMPIGPAISIREKHRLKKTLTEQFQLQNIDKLEKITPKRRTR